ncbi:MAG: ABC transporter ATP-binding protein [Candidatus Kariarchaeaceae archaeon]|jgi:ABC-type multidrug transport system fused ATPase/permease subunit
MMDSSAWKLISYMKRDKSSLFMAWLFNFLWVIPLVTTPFLIGRIFDVILNGLNDGNYNTDMLKLYLSGFILVIVFTYLFFCLGDYFTGKVAADSTEIIRNDMFSAIQKQSHRFFDDESTGDLVTKVTSDISNVLNSFFNLNWHGPKITGQFLIVIILEFYLDFHIGLIVCLTVFILYLSARLFDRRYSPLVQESLKSRGSLNNILTENFDAARISRVFNAYEKDIKRFDTKNSDYLLKNLRVHRTGAILRTQGPFIHELAIISVLVVTGFKFFNGDLSFGTLITIVFLAGYLDFAIFLLTDLGISYSNLKASSKRIVSVLEATPDIKDPENGVVLSKTRGDISFEDVSFAFQDEDILKDIHLEIPANHSIGILGATGSGKSALINLIPRFYDTREGLVKIDGIDVKSIDLVSLRKQIGLVDQETFLFSRSIRENIAFADPSAAEDKIIEVAKIAQIHDYIESLPDKYDTVIGERGVTLSGGQRQRLSIARALLADPKIVIFDDSLSAVDVKTESKIQLAIEALKENRTMVFVTQRLSTTRSTDFNVIIDRGRIIEKGTHDELMQENGIYARLFETQIDDIIDLSIIKEVVEVEIK